jgi:hypothetical protein
MGRLSLCNEALLRHIVLAIRPVLAPDVTGKVTIEINFHNGTPASAVAGFTEGMKLQG